MKLTPDEIIYWQWHFIKLNATIVTSWVLMLLIVASSILLTTQFRKKRTYFRFYVTIEIVISFLLKQLRDIGIPDPAIYLPFVGTLFIFLTLSALLTIIPGYIPPTSSLSTTAAFAITVFLAVPYYGIKSQGILGYLKTFFQPTFFMFPFNIAGEFSRTLALAIRLFGNMMSGTMIMAILLGITPLFFPVFLQILGLITGLVQAYIFTILSVVYIAAAIRTREIKGE